VRGSPILAFVAPIEGCALGVLRGFGVVWWRWNLLPLIFSEHPIIIKALDPISELVIVIIKRVLLLLWLSDIELCLRDILLVNFRVDDRKYYICSSYIGI